MSGETITIVDKEKEKVLTLLNSPMFGKKYSMSDYEEPEEEVIPPPPVQVFTPSQTYEITLNGTQQVPRNNTDTSATAVIEVDESLNLFTIGYRLPIPNAF